MKLIAIAAVLLCTPVLAQTLGEETGISGMLGRPPTAADLLIDLHQFDLFEQGADEIAQQRGDDSLREFSRSHADAAAGHDKELVALGKKAGLKLEFSEDPDITASDQLAGLQGVVGPAFVREYYEAEASEYDSAVSALRRYLQKPDQDDVRAFAAKQLPAFEAGQKSALENWTRVKR